MIWLIIYPLLTAFSLGIIKKYIKQSIDLIVISNFSIYLIIILNIIIKALKSPINYQLGNWKGSLGIGLKLGPDGVFMVCLIAIISYLILIYCSVYITKEKVKYYALILILVAAMMGLVLTVDLFNLYVFFEMTSIASYALAAVNKEVDNFEGVLKYLVIGSFGGLFILLAIIISYQLTGTLNLADLASQVKRLSYFQRYSIVSLLLIGFGSKIALVPLHPWMPDVYTFSNITFNALSSALIIKAVLYSLIKVIYTVFKAEFFINSNLQLILIYWGVITFLIAHILAYQQENIKRLLAYSSIAHMGYLIIAFSLATEAGIIAANFHLLNHALMKSSLFLISGIFALEVNSYQLEDWVGLGYKLPYKTLLFTMAALAIIGLPPFNGFISKWLIVKEIIQQGYYNAAFLLLMGTILSLIYYLNLIKLLYQKPQEDYKITNQNYRLTGVVTVTTALCFLLGLFPSIALNLINQTAILLGG